MSEQQGRFLTVHDRGLDVLQGDVSDFHLLDADDGSVGNGSIGSKVTARTFEILLAEIV